MVKKYYLRICIFIAAVIVFVAAVGCMPAAGDGGARYVYVLESDLTESPAPAGAAARTDPAVAAPASVRLDADAGDSATARLADGDKPADGGAYPGLSPAEVEHYSVGRHVGRP